MLSIYFVESGPLQIIYFTAANLKVSKSIKGFDGVGNLTDSKTWGIWGSYEKCMCIPDDINSDNEKNK